jgi:hypothetical protein
MTSLPIFEHLGVDDYGLYIGTKSEPGLSITFEPGLTLILGANGLGKTTFVTLLYRMCAGPYELRGRGGQEFGGRNIDAIQLSPGERRTFGARVNDEASNATATLTMTLGQSRFRVTRRLYNLSPTELRQDDVALEATESAFQEAIIQAAGVPTFGDWILLLRYLVFYFEDRRALVWDASAQRQIIRLLFLPAERAANWTTLERDVLQRDSHVRNLQATLTREEVSLSTRERAASGAVSIRDELTTLVRLQEVSEPKLDAANDRIAKLDSERQRARLNALTAELEHESAFRNLERLQLSVIGSEFPTNNETARYLIAQLFTDGDCLACGSHAQSSVEDLNERIAHNQCVICGSELASAETTPISGRALKKATTQLGTAAERLEATRETRSAAEQTYESLLQEVQTLTTAIAERRERIDSLIRRLPPQESVLHKQRDELAGLRGRVELLKLELAERRATFSEFIDGVSHDIVARADQVKEEFESFAEAFLLEPCELLWAPHKDTVGQSGQQIEYPAFELDMGGTNFLSPVRRSAPDEVSESQREFVDLAFRMTLMSVATESGTGSLVIDAPESSLDAVFVRRAADVLTKFAQPDDDNRLIVTSNLIEGDLIPELLRSAGIRSVTDKRVVDLLDIAAPTAATSKLHKEYAAVRRSLFQRANKGRR